MKKMDGISRTRVKALLANRVVLVDNNIQTQYNFPLKPGMKVQVSREKNKHEFRHPMLKILYEDAYLIVVEKKEGLLSVATDHQKERTAQHILNEYVKRTHRNNRIFVVHRLDRETSGIMMYAKDEKTQHTLRDNWHDIVYDRRYVSIVMGDMEKRTTAPSSGPTAIRSWSCNWKRDARTRFACTCSRSVIRWWAMHVTAAKPTRSDVWHSTPSSCASTTRLRANGWNLRLPILPRSRT